MSYEGRYCGNEACQAARGGFFGMSVRMRAATVSLPSSSRSHPDEAHSVGEAALIGRNTHPIHFHLVNVQVLGRQPFNMDAYNGTPTTPVLRVALT